MPAASMTMDFNPLQIERKNVGAVYKALAANARQNAEAASADKRMHYAQYEKARATAESYKNRAEATRAKASSVAYRANEFLKKAYDIQTQYSLNEMHKDNMALIQLSNSLAKVGDYLNAAKVDEEVTKGLLDGHTQANELSKQLDTDPLSVSQTIDQFKTEFANDPDNPYLRAKARYLLPLQTKAEAAVEQDRRNTLVQTYLTYLETNGLDLDPKYMEDFAKARNVPVSMLRDAEYTYVTMKYADSIKNAQSVQQLQSLVDGFQSVLKKRYDNKYLLQSNSPATRKLVSEANKMFSEAVREAKATIKNNAYSALAFMDANPLAKGVEPDVYKRTVEQTGANPEEVYNKTVQFAKKQQQAAYDADFLANYSIVRPVGEAFEKVSSEVKEEVVDSAAYELASNIVEGNVNVVTEAIKSNPEIVTKASDKVLNTFNQLSGVGKEQFYTSLRKMLDTGDSVEGLSNLIKDKDLSTILAAGTLVDIDGTFDEEGLNKSWGKALNMVAAKPSSERNILSRKSNQQLFDNMVQDAATMGKNGKRFTNVITQIYGQIGDATSNVYDKVKKYFESMQKVNEYPTAFDNLPEYKVVEYTGNGPDPFASLPDEGFAKEVKSKVFDKVREGLIKKGLSPDFHSIEYLPNNVVVFKDSFGGVVDVVDVTDVLKTQERRYMVQRQHTVTAGDVLRMMGKKGEKAVSDIWDWADEVTADTKKAAAKDKFMQGFKGVMDLLLGGMNKQ